MSARILAELVCLFQPPVMNTDDVFNRLSIRRSACVETNTFAHELSLDSVFSHSIIGSVYAKGDRKMICLLIDRVLSINRHSLPASQSRV